MIYKIGHVGCVQNGQPNYGLLIEPNVGNLQTIRPTQEPYSSGHNEQVVCKYNSVCTKFDQGLEVQNLHRHVLYIEVVFKTGSSVFLFFKFQGLCIHSKNHYFVKVSYPLPHTKTNWQNGCSKETNRFTKSSNHKLGQLMIKYIWHRYRKYMAQTKKKQL